MKKYWLQLAMGVIILAFVIKLSVDFEKLSKIEFRWVYFVLSIIAYSTLNLLLALRLKILLDGIDVKISLADVFKAHISGMLAGDVTPGRSGYILTTKFVDEIAKCGIEKPMVAVIAPQGVEFLLKGIGAFLAVLYLLKIVDSYIAIAILLLITLGVVISLLLFTSEKLSIRVFESLPLLKGRINLLDVKSQSKSILKFLPHILFLYFLGWLSVGLQWYFISEALMLNLSYLQTFLLHPLITALSFVPITPAGMGIMEGGGIVIFKVLGIDETRAFSFTILARLSNMIGDLPGLLFLRYLKSSSKPS